ncbi:Exported protein [Pseudomonas sp. IT-347P]|uniref:hypothetical protein n=1 Tax=Pseudomonas sp. IT-347P TaxID=3026458 RepID=UPI0039E0DF73
MKLSTKILGVCLALAMPRAEAATQEIRAMFQPDSSQPNKNVFVNQTPNSGYCAKYPGECAQNNMFSIQMPMRAPSLRPLLPGDGIPIKVPANWRQLPVINADTQETEIVEVRIIGIGSEFILSHSALDLAGGTDLRAAHQALWDSSSWVYAPAPCQYSGVGAYSPTTYRFFWKAPVEAECTKVANLSIPWMTFDTLDFAYELRTPNPLGMSSGLYTGSISYSIGPTGDFTFGPGFMPDDGNLTLDFVLDVQHTLKVDLPPGGNKVVLEPEGGWRSWLDSGRKPTRIFRDQMFYISASSRFKVMLECEFSGLFDCLLKDPATQRVTAVQLSISLPDGLNGTDGQPIKRRYLRIGENEALGVRPNLYADRKVGTLHFEIPQTYMDFILRPGQRDTYIGNVTVIWDSEA